MSTELPTPSEAIVRPREAPPMTQAEALKEVFRLFPLLFAGFLLIVAALFGPLFFYLWKHNPRMPAVPATHTVSAASVTLDASNYIKSMQFSDSTGTYRCGHGYHGIVCEKVSSASGTRMNHS